MKYIEQIDEAFVKTFAQNFFKKYYYSENVRICRGVNLWQVTGVVINDSNQPYEVTILLSDYGVSSKNTYALALGNRAWQAQLYKKFGDIYLKDLKECMTFTVINDMEKKLKDIDNSIEKIKNGNYDDRIM